ncbi:O-antigen ligase family protein [Tamlana crocina]|uniref:O-antigen ligase family protein n=1 Tax=Tamlana crocina TaxID=393006 RepID=A0ABX1DE72_9FLAO|nr:O-antigen ligase family protein [Tamlana crocina]NJX16635.1 O-antigen ligase family protein [Tamlana crocina]
MFRDKTVSTFLCLETKQFLTILLLIVLLVAIPQINLTDYPQSTITSKFIVIIYSCIGLFGFSIFWILKSKVTHLSLSNIDLVLVVLVIYIVINRYLFQTDYGFSIRFIELLGLVFLYVIFRTINVKLFYWLLLAIVTSGIIQAIYGNLQLLGYYPSNHLGFKLTGSFFNPGPYAGFLVSVFPIALGLYLFREKVISHVRIDIKNKSFLHLNTIIKHAVRYIPLIGIISIILVIPATQSRASWLAIIISSSLMFEQRYKILNKLFNRLSKLKQVVLETSIILIIGISLLGVYHFKKGSSDGRLFIWKVSTKMINDNPLFGVGFDRFKAHYMNYQANYFSEHGETQEALVADNTYYAFNEFIQFITEQGVFGFIILILILYFIIRTPARKENKYLNIIFKINLLPIGVFAFFSYPMEILPIKLIMVVLLSGLALLDQNKIKRFQTFKINTSIKLALKTSILVGLLLITVFSFNHVNRLDTSFKNWKLAQNNYQYGDYKSAIQEYEEAYPELKNNGEFLMNYGKALSIYKQDKKAIEILEQAKRHLNTTIIETAIGDAYKSSKKYKKAEFAYTKAYNMVPVRFYPVYLLAKLYDESNQKEKAIDIANKVLQKEIKVPSTAIKEIQLEMKKIIN